MSEFHSGAKTWALRRLWDQSEGSTDERREGGKLTWQFWQFFFFDIKARKVQLPMEKYKNKSKFKKIIV